MVLADVICPVSPCRKLHSGMKTYGCELCGKRFLDSLRLRMHLLSHSGNMHARICTSLFTHLHFDGLCLSSSIYSPLDAWHVELYGWGLWLGAVFQWSKE